MFTFRIFRKLCSILKLYKSGNVPIISTLSQVSVTPSFNPFNPQSLKKWYRKRNNKSSSVAKLKEKEWLSHVILNKLNRIFFLFFKGNIMLTSFLNEIISSCKLFCYAFLCESNRCEHQIPQIIQQTTKRLFCCHKIDRPWLQGEYSTKVRYFFLQTTTYLKINTTSRENNFMSLNMFPFSR